MNLDPAFFITFKTLPYQLPEMYNAPVTHVLISEPYISEVLCAIEAVKT